VRPVTYLKAGLTYLGASLSQRHLYACRAIVSYLQLGHWLREQGWTFPHIVASRWEVFNAVAQPLRDRRVLYLEFGVHYGDSIHHWASRLAHPETRLHGFDSFEGLPTAWGPYQRGYFDIGGRVPKAKDARVDFFKGWFEETLPKYEPPDHDALVIMLDADLYVSCAYVLGHVRRWIRPGTILVVDDMQHIEDAPRAFQEFIAASGLRFRGVVAERTRACAAFECV
jgi:hypothetical protein